MIKRQAAALQFHMHPSTLNSVTVSEASRLRGKKNNAPESTAKHLVLAVSGMVTRQFDGVSCG
jgi:hypothetical protein